MYSRFFFLAKMILIFIALMFISLRAQSSQLEDAAKYYKEGQYEKTLAILDKVIESGKASKEIYASAIDCNLQLKKYQRAIPLIENALTKFGSSYVYELTLAQLYGETGKTSLALNKLQKLSQKYPDSLSIKSYLSQLFLMQGGEFYKAEKLKDAAVSFQSALKYNPKSKDAHNNLIVVYMRTKKFKEALPYARDAYKMYPSESKFADIYIEVLITLENYQEAVRVGQKIAAENPSDIKSQLHLGLLYRYNQQLDEARALYTSLRTKYPLSREVYGEEIKWLKLYAPIDTIVARQREFLKNNPNDKDMYLAIAEQYVSKKSYDTARAIYREMERKDLFREAPVSCADTYIKEGKNDSAKYELARYIQSGGKTEEAYLTISALLRESGHSKEAKEYLILGIDRIPEYIDFYILLGKIYFEERIYDSVLTTFETIKSKYTEHPEISYYTARVFEEQKDSSRAVFQFQRFFNSALKQTGILQAQVAGSISGDNISDSDSIKAAKVNAAKLETITNLLKDGFKHFKAISTSDVYLGLLNELVDNLPGAAVPYLLRGRFYDEQGNVRKAQNDYETALTRTPYIEDVLQESGEFFMKRGNNEKAYELFTSALRVNKNSAKAYSRIIEAAMNLGKLDELCNYWKRLYESDMNNTIFKEFLIEALHKAGRYKDAEPIINQKNN